MAIVIDASVTMAWCFEDEITEATEAVLDQLRDDDAIVPQLWQVEVANVLLIAHRRKRITEAQSTHFLALLARLPIRRYVAPWEISDLVRVGRDHGLTAYDAAYLLLAERFGAALATLDDKLATACNVAGVELVLPITP